MADSAVSRLRKLSQLGQSPWYDNIDRRLIENGELKKLFDLGIVGVTSNPTIFEKAIIGSSVYDDKISALRKKGLSIEAIYDDLTADDVRDAAGLLKSVYEGTNKQDGYVSIEVLPAYAHDAVKTIDYARYIYKKIGCNNIMVKVPGTQESYEAIRELIRDGISINSTLIFSVSQYENAAKAFIDGMRDRLGEGKDISGIASVASVFISRIDTKVDAILDVFANRADNFEIKQKICSLKGKAAISNAKFIYQKFKDLFTERNFGDLKARGAMVQRPLWASTSTKNPAYSDCIYVDNLIGPKTVNTMPHQTVEAFLDHGKVALSLDGDLEVANSYLSRIQEIGINLATVCEESQKDGVAAFERSFETLMNAIKNKAV